MLLKHEDINLYVVRRTEIPSHFMFLIDLLTTYRGFNKLNFELPFKSIRAELIWRRAWQTTRQAEITIFEYINGFYNPRRRHSALS